MDPTLRIINRMRNLTQYKGLTDAEIKAKLRKKESAEKLPDDLDVRELFTDPEERKLGRRLMRKYLDEYEIQTIADRTTLKQLVYFEIFHVTRLQKAANDFQKKKQLVPTHVLQDLHRNGDKIISLKNSLGLARDPHSKENPLDSLFKKHQTWMEHHQSTRELICAYCHRPILLRIRTEAWESQEHPFFQDRIFGNEHLIRMYQSEKITKEDVAKVLMCPPDYIDWLVRKWRMPATGPKVTLPNDRKNK